MELAGEDGSVLELKEGHPLVLGRVAGLSHHDGSVSRHQVVVELLRPSSRKGKEIVGQSLGLKLQLQVVGRNPICVVNRGPEGKGKPKVKFLCNGQKDWLVSGDQISLSIKRPFFYELRFEGRSSPNGENASLDTKVNTSGVQSTPDRKSGRDAKFTPMDEEEGIAQAVAWRTNVKANRVERTPVSKSSRDDELAPMDEEEGIAQAVARSSRVKTNGVGSTLVTKSGKDARSVPMDEEEGIAQAVSRRRKLNSNGAESTIDRKDDKEAKSAPIDEEAGIAEAVARRQRRRLEREEATGKSSNKQQHQAENIGVKTEGKTEHLGNEETKVPNHRQQNERKAVTKRVENGEQAIRKQEEAISAPRNRGMRSVDPVTEFGFLVEGSEFSAYEKQIKANQNVWKSEIGQDKGKLDDYSERGGNKDRSVVTKSQDSDEEEEWGGDTQAEHDRLKIFAQKKGKRSVATRETRTRSPTSKRANSQGPGVEPSKKTREDSEESDDDDSSGSLADFIVDDDDPIEEDNGEDEYDVGSSRRRGGKTAGESQKPVCQYGSKCYRKNPEHRAQFYHPSA